MAERHGGVPKSNIFRPGNFPPQRLFPSFQAAVAECSSDRLEDRDPPAHRYRTQCVSRPECGGYRLQESSSAFLETAVADSAAGSTPLARQPARSDRAGVRKATP